MGVLFVCVCVCECVCVRGGSGVSAFCAGVCVHTYDSKSLIISKELQNSKTGWL